MKIVLDRKTAEQIAEEAAQLRVEVEKAGESLDYVERMIKAGCNLHDVRISALSRLGRARTAEEEFLRALYIIGVAGVEWVDYSDQRYRFNLDAALEAIEEEGSK